MKLTLLFKFQLLLLTVLFFQNKAAAQCINAYPYLQNFESSNGNWTPGGTASDWSWGTPIKPVINGAASGNKCWITGTLTQSSYSNNQNSTLTSPCFDLSSLASPYIRFSVFWETEKKYDGASFQYSIDGGASWNTLGSYADYQACPDNNWFNTNGITVLGADGWSGNIQPTASCTGGAGGGSGQWKVAQHTLMNLAGQSNVRFRFRFGAGSVCNNYDGFAIDDFWVGEAPTIQPDFSFSCTSSNTVSFQAIVSGCGPLYSWNFGDPTSGAANTSTLVNPTHTYATPGQYTVTLTIPTLNPVPPSISKQITILDINTIIVQPIQCNGDKGTLEALVQPPGNYNYSWNTVPEQTTAIASGLSGGTYTVQVTGSQACPITDQVTLEEPDEVKTFLGNDTVLCSGNTIQLDAGDFDSYLWQDGSTNRYFSVTKTGMYAVTVTDNNGCTDTDSIRVTVDCSDIYFPDAFTPDGNGRNESFGAIGNTAAVGSYQLRIYNRWGQLIFQTSDPNRKWDGTLNGKKLGSQSFAWFATYTISATQSRKQQKGTITVIR